MKKSRTKQWVLTLASLSALFLVLFSAMPYFTGFSILGDASREVSVTEFNIDKDSIEKEASSRSDRLSADNPSGDSGGSILYQEVETESSTSLSENVVVSSSSSGIRVSQIDYSFRNNRLNGVFTIDSPSNYEGIFTIALSGASNPRVTRNGNPYSDYESTSRVSETFIGILGARNEIELTFKDPRGGFLVEYDSPGISVKSADVTNVQSGEVIGSRITVNNQFATIDSVLLGREFDVSGESDIVARVFHRGEVITPNVFIDETRKVAAVNFYARVEGDSENNYDIVVVSRIPEGGEARIENTRIAQGEGILLASQVPEYCLPSAEDTPKFVTDCRVAKGDAGEIISNRNAFRLERERILEVNVRERGCPPEVRYVEYCNKNTDRGIKIKDPEISFSPTGEEVRSVSFVDEEEEILTTISVSETVDINFASAQSSGQIENSPPGETRKETDYTYFAIGMWTLFFIILPMIFFSFRDKETITIKRLINSVERALREGDKDRAFHNYHLLEKMYRHMNPDKKLGISQRYNECASLLKKYVK